MITTTHYTTEANYAADRATLENGGWLVSVVTFVSGGRIMLSLTNRASLVSLQD